MNAPHPHPDNNPPHGAARRLPKITKPLAATLLLALFAAQLLPAATYHVKNAGNDAQTGLSDDQAWRTVAKINTQSYSAGDSILFHRADVWRETLTPTGDGLTIGAYGVGALPVISGADPVIGLTSTGVNGDEHAGEVVDIDHAGGNTGEWSAIVQTGGTAAYSTEQARSPTGSLKLTGNGTDNRAYGRATFPAMTNGQTIHVFFAIYTPSGQFKANSQIGSNIGAAKVFVKLFTDENGSFDRIEMTDYGVTGTNNSKITVRLLNWQMDAWNTVELSYKMDPAAGGAELWVNGEKKGDNGYAFNTSSLTVEKVEIGNTAYALGLIAGGAFFIDDVKVSTSPNMAERYAVGNPNLWTATLATNPAQLFINGQRGQRMATAAEVTSYPRWHWDSATHTLSIHGLVAAPPAVEASVRDSGLDLQGRSQMTIENLRLVRAGRDGILARTLDRSTIQDCEMADCYITGIQLGGRDLRTDMLIRRNKISNAGGAGIGFGGQLDRWIIEENEVDACGVLTQNVVGYGDDREASFGWTSGIKIWGWGADGWVGYYTIRNNVVRSCKPVSWAPSPTGTHGHGIWCDEVLKPTARPEIHSNTVLDCYSRGVYLEKCDDHDAFNNVVYRCAQVPNTAAIEAQSNPFGYDVILDQPDDHAPRRVSGNRIFQNTAVGGWWSLSVSCSSAGCSISNTTVRDNICVGANGASPGLYLYGGGANNGTHGSGNSYVNNCFGTAGGSWVWGPMTYRTYSTFETASGGAVSNSVQGNPFFTNEAGGDFHLGVGSPCLGTASVGGNVGAFYSLFAKWQSDFFTPGEVLGGWADVGHDPDADGWCNLLEYALGGNPQVADQPGLFGVRTEASQFLCEAEYRRSDPNVSIHWETSTDLVLWEPAVPVHAEYFSNGDQEHVILRFDIAPGQPRLFLRMKARLL